MEKIILENVQDLIKEEPVSPISTQRPRTDWIKNYREKIRLNLSATFQKTNIFVQKNADLLCTSECWNCGHEKPHERVDTEIRATSITNVTSSLPEDEYTGSSRALVSVDGCALLLVQDEQPEVTNCDKLGSYSLDDAGGEVAKFHTVPDAAPDTSSHPDCKLLLESLEDEPPGGCNLPDGNVDEGAKAQCSIGQIKAFSPTSGDEELRCQQGYTQNGTVICEVWSESAKAELCVQKKEFDSATTFWSDYSNTSFNPNVVEKHSGHLDQSEEIEEEKFELQICENEEVAVSETKGQVNENSLKKNAIHCEAECAEGSAADNDVVSPRNIVTENVNLKAGVFSGAKGKHTAGEMIAKAQRETADHTAETPVPARISQESAEGDNDVSPFSAIDPAIWSETDREAVQGRSSQCTAGADLSLSLSVSDMKVPLLLFDVTLPKDASFLGQTQQFKQPRGTQPCDDEKEDFCQTSSPSANAAHLKTSNEGHFLWKTCLSSSPKCPPVQDEREESIETVEHLIKEHNLSGCFQANLENLKAQVFHGLESETLKKDGSTMIKTEDETSVGCEMLVMIKDGHQQGNQKQAAMIQATPDCFSGCSETNISDSSRVLASTLPTHWDAVVPEPQEVNPSYHAVTIATARNCSDTLSPVPSVFTFGDRVPAGFDAFQRIQLSLEDDDKRDYSGSNSPLCSPLQPRRHYHSILEAESTNQHEVAPEEEEGKDVERFKCHTENTTDLSSDYSYNDMPNLTTTPIRWPERHVNSRSAVGSPDHGCSPASSLKKDIEFDMKKHFDLVLKELRLYFEISVNEFFSVGNGSVPRQCGEVTKVPEEETSQQFFSPDLMHQKNTASGKFKQGL